MYCKDGILVPSQTCTDWSDSAHSQRRASILQDNNVFSAASAKPNPSCFMPPSYKCTLIRNSNSPLGFCQNLFSKLEDL